MKRKQNVETMLYVFISYFSFHGAFFLVFSLQNYFFYSENRFQFCFVILIVFYTRFIVGHICQLRNKRDMRRMGKWLKPRLYLKIVEHGLLAVSMALIPFYLQDSPLIWVPGWLLVIPPSLSSMINLFVVKYD